MKVWKSGGAIFGGHNLPPLVEIGLTDLPKSEGAMAPPPGDDTPAKAQHNSAGGLWGCCRHSFYCFLISRIRTAAVEAPFCTIMREIFYNEEKMESLQVFLYMPLIHLCCRRNCLGSVSFFYDFWSYLDILSVTFDFTICKLSFSPTSNISFKIISTFWCKFWKIILFLSGWQLKVA